MTFAGARLGIAIIQWAVLREILGRYERPCLLCACDQERTCHRRLLAEALQEERPELEVHHLR